MVHCFVCFPPVDSVLHKEKGLIHVLGLREIDFDSAGDFKFPSGNGDKQMRGGMPYYQPNSNWTRIGLRVRRRYDNGNDDWLKMDGNPHEWAVGFHGSTKKAHQILPTRGRFGCVKVGFGCVKVAKRTKLTRM